MIFTGFGLAKVMKPEPAGRMRLASDPPSQGGDEPRGASRFSSERHPLYSAEVKNYLNATLEDHRGHAPTLTIGRTVRSDCPLLSRTDPRPQDSEEEAPPDLLIASGLARGLGLPIGQAQRPRAQQRTS